jgi:transcriptional regulator with XRE-family HTH domain
MTEKRAKRSPGFEAKVNAELAELRIGLIVKELRRKKKLTQEELARRIKTTKSAISRLENSSGEHDSRLLARWHRLLVRSW